MQDRTLGSRYALEREIGRGGMGVVYRAHDLKYDRPVAVKFLNADASSAVGAERFADEIRTTARLRHQNILQVDDSDEVDGELFYVMPYVEGPSIRERLERGPRIGVAEALRIARQVAAALAYAHSHGIIHRDIKPDNILLGHDGHVYVADFGLAHVLARSENRQLTAVGLALGTPAYMSPEQATCEPLDGRSDLYSLGCVLFETLAGEPPFSDTDPAATMRRQVVETAPSLRRRRADVSPSLDRVVARLLEKDAEDRYPSADALAEALDVEIARLSAGALAASPDAAETRSVPRRWIAGGIAVVAVASLVWWVTHAVAASDAPLDEDRWLVLPLSWQGGVPAELRQSEDALLRSAFARWRDLELVPPLTDAAISDIPEGDAVALARDLDAGSLLHGIATIVGDSIQLDLRASNATDGRSLSRVSLRVPRDEQRAATYAVLVDSLLFGRVTWDGIARADIGTSSSVARRAYGAAHTALQRWDMPSADSLFGVAAETDPDFGRAQLWLAQVRNWAGRPSRTWLPQIERAASNRAALTPREQLLADGLLLMGQDRLADACALYRQLIENGPRDFAGYYGLGECLGRDRIVVRDASTPSGWRFRSSRHEAITAYAAAYRLLPSVFHGIDASATERLLRILITHSSGTRDGESANGESFISLPAWRGDTLAMVPYPSDVHASPLAHEWESALVRHRHLFHDIARTWASAFPRDPDALYALAMGQEMLGDGQALQTIREARTLSSDPAQRVRLGIREVWILVKFGAGQSTEDLLHAREIADSLLAWPAGTDRGLDDQLAAIAVLVGRPSVAADYAASASSSDGGAVPTSSAARLLAFASVGGPVDSIREYQSDLDRGISSSVPRNEQPTIRAALMEQAAILAFPAYRFHEQGEWNFASPVADAQALVNRNEPDRAIALVQSARLELRPDFPHEDVSFDILFAEATVLAIAGDSAAALGWIAPALDGLPGVQPLKIENMARAGAFIRATGLRAELESAAGNPAEARRWAAVIATLWAHGDRESRAVSARMRARLGG